MEVKIFLAFYSLLVIRIFVIHSWLSEPSDEAVGSKIIIPENIIQERLNEPMSIPFFENDTSRIF